MSQVILLIIKILRVVNDTSILESDDETSPHSSASMMHSCTLLATQRTLLMPRITARICPVPRVEIIV